MVFGLGKKKKKEKNGVAEKEAKSTTKDIESGAGKSADTMTTKDNASTGARPKKRRVKKTIVRVSQGYDSPLRTIAETEGDDPRTRDTHESGSSFLKSVNVMVVSPEDGSTEVVFAPSPTEKGEMHDENDVRKKLFTGEGGEPEAVASSERRAVSPESPFDEAAEYGGPEDPTILDMTKNEAKFEEEKENEGAEREDKTGARVVEPKSAVARKLLAAFNCGDDTTRGTTNGGVVPGLDLVVNTLCGPIDGNSKRPRFDPELTMEFLKETVKRGIPLLYHLPSEGADDASVEQEWSGRSVHMTIKLGSYLGTHLIQPRLEWSTLGGGWSRTGTPDITTTSVELLSVHSIIGEIEEEREDFGAAADDLCFFTITTDEGNVYLFEAATPIDRDRIVFGLKSVIARLTYHLIAGDSTVSSELYGEERLHASGELPSLRTPAQGLNEISHAFLD